jgi:hypothetical protein
MEMGREVFTKSVSQSRELLVEKGLVSQDGSGYVNTHPVSRLFLKQVYHLAQGSDYFGAYETRRQKAIRPDLR